MSIWGNEKNEPTQMNRNRDLGLKLKFPLIIGEASTWGLNPWDGSDDKGDVDSHGNPLPGFFIDPATGEGYRTHNKWLLGCAIPEIIMMRTLGLTGGWAQNAATVQHWVYVNQPEVVVTNLKNGITVTNVKVVDVGPAKRAIRCLDRTYALTWALDPIHGTDPIRVSWYMKVNGGQFQMAGWSDEEGVLV
jgi:hypothetical protein